MPVPQKKRGLGVWEMILILYIPTMLICLPLWTAKERKPQRRMVKAKVRARMAKARMARARSMRSPIWWWILRTALV